MGASSANLDAFPRLLAACQAVVARWEHGDLAEAARMCNEAVDMALGLGGYSPDPRDRLLKKTRRVEYYRLWSGNSGDSGTWDTDFIDIPANTPDDKIDGAIRKAAAKIEWRDGPPVIVGYYCDAEQGDEEDGRQEAIDALLAKAETAGLKPEDLDEIVHELASSIAADINNSGMEGQIEYMIDQMGVQETTKQLDRWSRNGQRPPTESNRRPPTCLITWQPKSTLAARSAAA